MKQFLHTATEFLRHVGIEIKKVVSRRLGLKLLSLGLAILLWGYIVTSNTSLTRLKTLENLSVARANSDFLSSYTLALGTDVTVDYAGAITVTVELPQSQFSSLSSKNVTIMPDYSAIRSAGVYDVPLIATSTIGSVVSVSPSVVSVAVEDLDSRDLAVEYALSGTEDSAYWYNIDQKYINPQQITVSGPASLVQKVESALIVADTSGHTSPFRKSLLVRLMDENNEQLTSRLLTKSSSTCSVIVDVYPSKVLSVSADSSQIAVADGYTITGISFQPSTVTVAGESSVLAGLEYLPLELPANEVPASNTYTTRLNVSGLSDFKYISPKSVYMTVSIAEETLTRTFSGIPIVIRGAAGVSPVCEITVSGPISVVTALSRDHIEAFAEIGEAVDGEITVTPTVSFLVSDADSLTYTVTDVTLKAEEVSNE